MKITPFAKGLAIPPVFTAGFRFYFLVAGCYAVIAVAAWLVWLQVHAMGGAFAAPIFSMAPHHWHAHEMIYGYGVAVLAGFFLTALPNWTGEPPARAAYIAATGAIWLAGRLAIWFSGGLPPLFVAAIDLAFVPFLGAKVAGNLIARMQTRNFILLGLLTLLFTGNLRMHLEWAGLPGGDASAGMRLGLLVLTAMISVIGGRIIPGFTRNALNRRGAGGPVPAIMPRADKAAILAGLLTALAAGFGAPDMAVGAFALAAAFVNGFRLARWRWQDTFGEPILWSLHLAFLMLAVGYATLALALLTGAFSEVSALHILGIGAVGGMTLAVMSRAALGHTGRPLIVARPIAFAYAAITAAALIRSFGLAMAPGHYFTVMLLSGGFWLAGFALFAGVYLPILTRKEARGTGYC
jgi:uncharacterized protein involved in response to NO